MVKRLGIAAALVAMVSACGSGGNVAASKKFTYGSPSSASSTQSSALDSSIASTSSQNSSLSASGINSFGATSSVTTSLLGSSAVASGIATSGPAASVNPNAGRTALIAALSAGNTNSFDNPACVVVTATSVTMKGCLLTNTDTNGTSKITADGSLSKTAAGALTWDLKVAATFTGTSSSGSFSLTMADHASGTLTFTSTTLKGSMLSEVTIQASGNGQSVSAGVDESVDVDVTFTAGPPSCVTGGTLEAKRVWTQRPNGVSSAQLPDRGAKVTWTSCGNATVALSTN